MKLAIVGSRSITVDNIGDYMPPCVTTIISGGAKGVDQSAAQYAKAHEIELVEYLPAYHFYGRKAPLYRNKLIVEACDMILAFWHENSRGTKFTIDYAKAKGKVVRVIKI